MMRYSRSALFLLAFGAVSSLSTPVLAEEISIVKEDHSVEMVSAKELKRMLLGKSKRWKNGDKVVVGTLQSGVTHDRFIRKYAGKTPKQFTNYWRKMVFSGKGAMPKAFATEEAMASFVSERNGALGYVDDAQSYSGTKELRIHK